MYLNHSYLKWFWYSQININHFCNFSLQFFFFSLFQPSLVLFVLFIWFLVLSSLRVPIIPFFGIFLVIVLEVACHFTGIADFLMENSQFLFPICRNSAAIYFAYPYAIINWNFVTTITLNQQLSVRFRNKIFFKSVLHLFFCVALSLCRLELLTYIIFLFSRELFSCKAGLLVTNSFFIWLRKYFFSFLR